MCPREDSIVDKGSPTTHSKVKSSSELSDEDVLDNFGGQDHKCPSKFAAKLSLGSTDRPKKMHPNIKLLDILNILKLLHIISGNIDEGILYNRCCVIIYSPGENI